LADLVSSFISGKSEEKVAKKAADAQVQQAQMGIAETRRAEGVQRQDLAPYTDAGMNAIGLLEPYYEAGLGSVGGLRDIADGTGQGYQGMRDIAGMNTPQAQQAEMERIRNSPEFMASLKESEDAILRNAAATGGLRGGGLNRQLMQNSNNMFNQAVDKQFGRYGQFAGMGGDVSQFLASSGQNIGTNIFGAGQASAAGTGAAAMQSAGQVANLMGGIGQAQAGAALASNRGIMRANEAHQSTLSDAGQFVASLYGGSIK
jgi:hypothetical protein